MYISEYINSVRDFSVWRRNRAYINEALRKRADKERREAEKKAQFAELKRMHDECGRSVNIDWDERLLCYEDDTVETPFDRHYTYHPAWAARILEKTRPGRHSDFSSTLNFCVIASAFVPVDFYDFRPAPVHLPNLRPAKADLTNLEAIADGSLESVSCMHVIEHIGLGRYGDRLDPNGDIQAIRELIRVTKPGGNLLVVVPVGRGRVVFNAHRIYSHSEWLGYFSELSLIEFALIPDGLAPDGMLINPPTEIVDAQSYGCGCYWFQK